MVHILVQSFLDMIRERKGKSLRAWMEEANTSGIAEMKSFVGKCFTRWCHPYGRAEGQEVARGFTKKVREPGKYTLALLLQVLVPLKPCSGCRVFKKLVTALPHERKDILIFRQGATPPTRALHLVCLLAGLWGGWSACVALRTGRQQTDASIIGTLVIALLLKRALHLDAKGGAGELFADVVVFCPLLITLEQPGRFHTGSWRERTTIGEKMMECVLFLAVRGPLAEHTDRDL